MANGRGPSWAGIGIGVGVAALGGGILWYLTRSGKASANPFVPSPEPAGDSRGGPPPPPPKPGVTTVRIHGGDITVDGKPATMDQAVDAAKAAAPAVEINLYLASDNVRLALKDRFQKAGIPWNPTEVVSIGGLVRAGSNARGVYG